MTSYTITIAPNDDSGNTTTVVVDTSGDEVTITDVHLHAGLGLSGGRLPTVDFGLLLRAVTASTAPRPVEAAPADPPIHAERTAPADSVAEQRPDPAATPRAARTRRRAADAAPEPESPVRRGRGGRARAAKTAAPEVAVVPVRRTSKATKATSGKTGRAYRRMPDDFAEVFEQIGGAAATAEHYGVPRHTVQNWIRRLRATNATQAQ